MKIGYARVSTGDQTLDLQMDALKAAGCDKIFTDTASGSKCERPGLQELLSFIREGDTLVVWKLDRLGRSIQHLIDLMKQLETLKASFYSLQENIDTSTSMGKFIFHFVGALAEFERDLIRERTHAGLKAARARGRFGGRPASLGDKQVTRMRELYEEGNTTVTEICKLYNVSRRTFYNYVPKETA